MLDAEYWTATSAARCSSSAVCGLCRTSGCDVLLEIGPHPVLVGMGQACWRADGEPLWVGSLRRGPDDTKQMLDATGAMYAAGVDIDFASMDAPWRSVRRKIALPFYPFQHRRFWIEAPESAVVPAEAGIQDCLYEITWEQRDATPRPAEAVRGETWLVLADKRGLASALCRELERAGQETCLRGGGRAHRGIGGSISRRNRRSEG